MKNIFLIFLVVVLSPILLSQSTNFEGITYSGEIPPDPVIAVSNDYIVQAVNKKLAVFNKSGAKLFEQSFSIFFSNQMPPQSIFDPKVVYDQYSDRFILLAAGMNTNYSNSNYMLAVTQGSNPTGDWYKYKLNAVDQNFPLYNIDYPGLGYDEEAIYLTSHQIYNVGGSTSHYPKITILKKSEVYSNTISYRKDFIDFSSGGSYPEKLKPMRKFGSSSGYFLVNTESAGQIRIWKIVNPLGGTNATLSAVSTIPLGNNYSEISEAVQKGSENTVNIGDYSISDVVCKDGYLYGAYTAKNNNLNGSIIVYFKVNTNNNYNLDISGKIENENKYYYYPVIHPDNYGNIVFAFNKSSNDDYIGVAWTIRYSGNPNIEPIQWLKEGSTWYYHLLNDKNRWGDYCGIALDPNNGYRVWICGEWAYSNDQWSTWIGNIGTAGTTNFTFTNTIHDEDKGILNENAGGTITVSSFPDPVTSGGTLPLELGEPYNEKTNNERFPDWEGTGFTFKHNNWNNELNNHFLSNNFDALLSAIDQRAFFQSLNYSKVEDRLEGYLIDQIGYFEFYDPWFVKSDGSQPGTYWRPCYSYYEPTGNESATEKGVFLNQPYTGNNPVYYKVKALGYQDINLGGQIGTRRFYFRNWSGTGVEFQDASSFETGVVFTSSDATASAVLKGVGLSNNQNGYGTGSQQKFVRLYDGTLFSIYTSLNKVWIERSVTNGQDWNLWPNSLPFDNSSEEWEFIPSIDWIPWTAPHSFAVIANITPNFYLRVRVIRQNTITPYYDGTLQPIWGNYTTPPLTPVVSVSQAYIMVIGNTGVNSNAQEGLYYFYGTISFNGSAVSVSWIDQYTPKIIPGSTQNSKNPTIMADKDGNTFHIAWQDGNHIKYCNATVSGNNITFSNLVTPSSNCGYEQYYSPSIVVMETDNLARLCWVGRRYVCQGDPEIDCQGTFQYKVLFKGLNNLGRYWSFGGANNNIVSSPNINKKNNNTSNPYYAFGWYESSGENKFADNTLSTVRTLNTIGQRVQICNGTDKNNMYAMSFNYSSVPYYFQMSDSLGSFYSMEKIQYNAFTTGREGIVSTDSADFYFAMGDIEINGQPVDFVEIDDTVQISNLSILNEYLISEQINVSDNCSFVYSVQYGINDSLSAATAMIDDRFINFKVQLVDANTGEIIGEYDEITYDAVNIYNYGNISYQVNTEGIGNRTVRLKLIVNNNFSSNYSLGKIYSDESVLGKTNVQQINFNGNKAITSYDLSQNYPNPFNPLTAIRYQIPKAGNVVLKVYDILGSEIITLVDEFKEVGKFEISFDASKLASGVYIYRLNVNDYVSVKKMVLLR